MREGMRAWRRRAAFAATLAMILSLSGAESPGDHLSPQQLETPDLGESAKGGPVTVPLAVVRSFAQKVEAENKHLQAENAALRTQTEVDNAKEKIMVAGGAPKPDTPKAKTEEEKAAALPPPSELPREVKKGKKVMDQYSKQNRALEMQLAKANAKVTAMKQTAEEATIHQKEQVLKAQAESKAEAATYHRIPFFKFSAGSKRVPNVFSQVDCQEVCNRQSKCKSFSWSTALKTCLFSVDAVHYDDEYVLVAKAQLSTPGDPSAEWRRFPGVKFITAHSNDKENVALETCEAMCANDAKCKSFSYRKDTKFCSWSSNGLSYDTHFNYFEKDQASLSKIEEAKKAKLAKAEEKMKADMVAAQKKEEQEREKEEKENEQKKKERNAFIMNQPSKSQEMHLKMTVKREMGAMDAKFATKSAKKKEEMEKKAADDYTKEQLGAVSRISKLDAQLKKLEADKKEEAKKLPPLEKAAAEAQIAVAKLNSKLKIISIDIKLKQNGVEQASKALSEAHKSQSSAAIKASSEAYNEAKKAVSAAESAKGKLVEDLADLKKNLDVKSQDLKDAMSKEKSFKLQAKSNESTTKDAVKSEKASLAKMKLALMQDKEKAFTSKMVALKAKEKMAKSRRAHAKVSAAAAENKLQNGSIKTDEDRRKVQKEIADAKGDMFKGDKENSDVSITLVDTAESLAGVKETLHKSKVKVQQKKDADKRQNVKNKFEQLENEPINTPASTEDSSGTPVTY